MLKNCEIIKFKNHKIYKVKVDELNNDELLNEIKKVNTYIIGENEITNTKGTGPGIQIQTAVIENEIIQKSRKLFLNYCDDLFNHLNPERKKLATIRIDWIFISKPKNEESNYHNHTKFTGASSFDNMNAEYTYTYYVQMPNNLEGNDGVLYFKENLEDVEEFTILPEQGYLYFFDAKLWHRPEISKSSKLDRIVMASNFGWLLERDKTQLI